MYEVCEEPQNIIVREPLADAYERVDVLVTGHDATCQGRGEPACGDGSTSTALPVQPLNDSTTVQYEMRTTEYSYEVRIA